MSWESFYGNDDFTIGVYGRETWNEFGPSSHMKPHMKALLGKVAAKEKGIVKWSKNQAELNECDLVCREQSYFHLLKSGVI